ncbi:MAG: hypothetical protein IJX68_00565 [Rikenellaceae bacterium]|nr:hypothetical protein [Rikenellaceae bacterium]
MKRLLTLIIAAIALQSCSMTHTGSNYYPYGYDVPVSPTHISINIDKQPAWGPYGYDCAAFYYMPEINIYYDVNLSLFYYPSGSSWIAAQYLPPSYRVYDLFRTYKVVLNYASPWQHNDSHRSQYRRYRDDRSQITISMSNDHRYSKSWDNLRPWVDPNRRSNRKQDYKQHPNSQPTSSDKYIEDHRNNGYRVEGTEHKKQGQTAGSSYRGKDKTPNKGTSSSSSYRNQQQSKQPATDKKPTTDKKPATEKPQKPATSSKPSTEKADRQPSKTDKSYNAPSSSSSYRQQNGAQSSSRSDGVSSRGKARNQSTAESKSKTNSSKSTTPKSSSSKSSTKPSTEKSTRSKSNQPSSNTSPSASYRASNSSSANTSTRGR